VGAFGEISYETICVTYIYEIKNVTLAMLVGMHTDKILMHAHSSIINYGTYSIVKCKRKIVPVLNQSSTTPCRRMEEWISPSTFS
jgi:hypothetical protein